MLIVFPDMTDMSLAYVPWESRAGRSVRFV